MGLSVDQVKRKIHFWIRIDLQGGRPKSPKLEVGYKSDIALNEATTTPRSTHNAA